MVARGETSCITSLSRLTKFLDCCLDRLLRRLLSQQPPSHHLRIRRPPPAAESPDAINVPKVVRGVDADESPDSFEEFDGFSKHDTLLHGMIVSSVRRR